MESGISESIEQDNFFGGNRDISLRITMPGTENSSIRFFNNELKEPTEIDLPLLVQEASDILKVCAMISTTSIK